MHAPRCLTCLAVVVALLAGRDAASEPLPLVPLSPGVHGNVYTAFQANTPLRRPNDDDKKVYPFYQYLDLSAVSPEHNLSVNTFVRAREVANGDDATFDVYNAYLDYRLPSGALQVRAGRQILTEGVNFTLMDGALLRAKPLEGIDVIAYGGYQDADLQPYPEKPEQSFGIFGAKVRSSRHLGALMALGYEGLTPDGFPPRHFLTFSFKRAVPYTDIADFYSRLELDILEGEAAFFNSGVGISVARPVYVNVEYDSYRPDPNRDRFLQDRIFDVFSISRLHEARLGVTYYVTRYLDVSTSYSFATYDKLSGSSVHGNIWKLGFSWNFWQQLGLRAFNGMYLIDGGGDDRAIGVNCGVSEEILRGLQIHALFAFAHFDSISGKDGDAYSYIAGTQYMVARSVALLAEVEYNTNPDFETDVRGNLGVTYFFSWS